MSKNKKDHNNNRSTASFKEPPQSKLSSLEDKLAKANHLEQYLISTVAASKTNLDSKASSISIQLCEIFSDILLTDPTFALKNDITGKLWRNCFYGHIGELRSRLKTENARFRKKKDKELQTSAQNQATTASLPKVDDAAVKKCEEALHTFINEAIILYEYLIDQMQGRLLPSTQTSSSPISSQNEKSKKDLIPMLYHLYIHLGDLHRYGSSYTASESAYLRASYLSPSKGNPYNQLAVVAQMKDVNMPVPAVACYWYARSIMSRKPFETSHGNLTLLFKANDKWLERSNIDSTPNHDDEEIMINTSGLNREQARSVKSKASRRFLSQYVHFHGKLFFNLFSPHDTEKNTSDIRSISKVFDILLNESSFSDALLMKIISINIFSMWNCSVNPNKEKSTSSVNPDQQQKLCFNKMIATILNDKFGSILTKHVTDVVDKVSSKQDHSNRKKNSLNLRLLGPLLLLSEYISYHTVTGDTNHLNEYGDYKAFGDQSRSDFWAGIANVANSIKDSSVLSVLLNNDSDVVVEDDSISSLPGDLQTLVRGCETLSFLDTDESKTSSYISPEAAIDALNLYATQTQSQLSQESSRSKKPTLLLSDSSNSIKSEEDSRSKVRCFMKLVSRHCDTGELLLDNGKYVCVSATTIGKGSIEKAKDIIDDEEDYDTTGMVSFYGDDHDSNSTKLDEEAEDVVVYKETKSGQKLLVPGALFLANKDMEESPALKKPKNNQGIDLSMLVSETAVKSVDQIELNHSSLPDENAFDATSFLDDVSKGIVATPNPAKPIETNVTLGGQMAEDSQPSKTFMLKNSPSPTASLNKTINVPSLSAEKPITNTIRPPPGFSSLQGPNHPPIAGTSSMPSSHLLMMNTNNYTPQNLTGLDLRSTVQNSGVSKAPQDMFSPYPTSDGHSLKSHSTNLNLNSPGMFLDMSMPYTRNPFANPTPPLEYGNITGRTQNHSNVVGGGHGMIPLSSSTHFKNNDVNMHTSNESIFNHDDAVDLYGMQSLDFLFLNSSDDNNNNNGIRSNSNAVSNSKDYEFLKSLSLFDNNAGMTTTTTSNNQNTNEHSKLSTLNPFVFE